MAITSTWLDSIREGDLARDRDGLKRAEFEYRAAVRLARRQGTRSVPLAIALGRMAQCWADYSPRARRAFALARLSLAMKEALLGPNHPEIARSLELLGEIYLMGYLWDCPLGSDECQRAALSLGRRALAIRANRFGVDHREYALGLVRLAELGEQEPQSLLNRALAIQEAMLPTGTRDRDMADTLEKLAERHVNAQRLEEAIVLRRRALTIREQHPDWRQAEYVTARLVLAGVLEWIGRWAEAEELFRAMLKEVRGAEGSNTSNTVRASIDVARICFKREVFYEARSVLDHALTAAGQAGEDGTGAEVDALELSGDLHLASGRLEDAADAYGRALTALDPAQYSCAWLNKVFDLREKLAEVCLDLGKPAEAVTAYAGIGDDFEWALQQRPRFKSDLEPVSEWLGVCFPLDAEDAADHFQFLRRILLQSSDDRDSGNLQ